MAEASSLETLPYAPRPSWHRRKRWRRGVVVVALLLITTVGWYWLQPWRRVQIVYWQRRCMKMTPPADGQIEILDPAKVGAALRNPDYIAGVRLGLASAHWHPEAWTKFRTLCMRPGVLPGSDDPKIVFLGTRSAPGGESRLVMVSNRGLFLFASQGHLLGVNVIRPATLWRDPESHANTVAIPYTDWNLDLSAGRADASDSSHIIIPCKLWLITLSGAQGPAPRSGQVDLYLQNDDTLRAGPLPEP